MWTKRLCVCSQEIETKPFGYSSFLWSCCSCWPGIWDDLSPLRWFFVFFFRWMLDLGGSMMYCQVGPMGCLEWLFLYLWRWALETIFPVIWISMGKPWYEQISNLNRLLFWNYQLDIWFISRDLCQVELCVVIDRCRLGSRHDLRCWHAKMDGGIIQWILDTYIIGSYYST